MSYVCAQYGNARRESPNSLVPKRDNGQLNDERCYGTAMTKRSRVQLRLPPLRHETDELFTQAPTLVSRSWGTNKMS